MYLQIFEINEISSDFNGFLNDFKSRTGFWGVSDPSITSVMTDHKIIDCGFEFSAFRYKNQVE